MHFSRNLCPQRTIGNRSIDQLQLTCTGRGEDLKAPTMAFCGNLQFSQAQFINLELHMDTYRKHIAIPAIEGKFILLREGRSSYHYTTSPSTQLQDVQNKGRKEGIVVFGIWRPLKIPIDCVPETILLVSKRTIQFWFWQDRERERERRLNVCQYKSTNLHTYVYSWSAFAVTRGEGGCMIEVICQRNDSDSPLCIDYANFESRSRIYKFIWRQTSRLSRYTNGPIAN